VLKLDGNLLSKVLSPLPGCGALSKGNLQIWQRYLVGLKALMDESPTGTAVMPRKCQVLGRERSRCVRHRMKMVIAGDHALDKACLLQSITDFVRPRYCTVLRAFFAPDLFAQRQ
jgi:hypothetical protein